LFFIRNTCERRKILLKNGSSLKPMVLNHQPISFETTISGGGWDGDDGKSCCCWPPYYTCKWHKKRRPWKPPGYCFITNSCVETKGLPDDCFELTTLRRFRDNVLLKSPGGKELVNSYYEVASSIALGIDNEPDPKKIYEDLYNNLILTCVNLISKGKNEDAEKIYRDIVGRLESKYI
jgi:hypothetical protein